VSNNKKESNVEMSFLRFDSKEEELRRELGMNVRRFNCGHETISYIVHTT